LQLLLKGVPFIYSGEEYGQHDKVIKTLADISDVAGLKAYTNALVAGLTPDAALEIGKSKTRDYSRGLLTWEGNLRVLTFFKQLMSIRAENKSLARGDITELSYTDEIISFKRSYDNTEMTIKINTGKQKKSHNTVDKIIFAHKANNEFIKPNGLIIIKAVKS
jgi:glycosidase